MRARRGSGRRDKRCSGFGPRGFGSYFQLLAMPGDSRATGEGEGEGRVQAAVSIVSPPGTRQCLGTVGCAAAPGPLGPPPGSGEAGSRSCLAAALDAAWPVLARSR